MEFRFNVNELFKQPIVELGSNLIPPGFQGDRRQLWDAVSKVSEVVNTMGEASASAQGLSKPITTAERLRNSENQKIYVLVDRSAQNGKGAVTGMLKTGQKGLYLFDREGEYYQVQPQCILDFYVHESKQRSGFGKMLFEHMLEKENVEPISLAIDRPSDKFLGFLKKHYNLNSAIRQMNNYVVFDGFFPEMAAKENNSTIKNDNSVMSKTNKRGSNGLQQNVTSPYGRYGAPRPVCSMGQIIHNQKSTVNLQEPTGSSHSLAHSVKSGIALPSAYQQCYQNEGLIPQPQSVPQTTPQNTNLYGSTTPMHNTLSDPAYDVHHTRSRIPRAGNGLGEIASDNPNARSKLMSCWNQEKSLEEPQYHWPFLKPSRSTTVQPSRTGINSGYYNAPYATMQDVVPQTQIQQPLITPQQAQLSPSQYKLYSQNLHSQSNVVDHNLNAQQQQQQQQGHYMPQQYMPPQYIPQQNTSAEGQPYQWSPQEWAAYQQNQYMQPGPKVYEPTTRTPEQEQLVAQQKEYVRNNYNAMVLQQKEKLEQEQRHVQDSRVPQTLAEMKEYKQRLLTAKAEDKIAMALNKSSPKQTDSKEADEDDNAYSMQAQTSRSTILGRVRPQTSKYKNENLSSRAYRFKKFEPGNGMQDINDDAQSQYLSIPQMMQTDARRKPQRNVKSAHSSISHHSIKSPRLIPQSQTVQQPQQQPMAMPQQMMQQPMQLPQSMAQQPMMEPQQAIMQAQQQMMQAQQQMMQPQQQMMQPQQLTQPQQQMMQPQQQMMSPQQQMMQPQQHMMQPQQQAMQPQQVAQPQQQMMQPQQQMMQPQKQMMQPQQQMMQPQQQMMHPQQQMMQPRQQMMQPQQQPMTYPQTVMQQPPQTMVPQQLQPMQYAQPQSICPEQSSPPMPEQNLATPATQYISPRAQLTPQQQTFATQQQQQQTPQTHMQPKQQTPRTYYTQPQEKTQSHNVFPQQDATIPLTAVTGHTNVQDADVYKNEIPPAEATYMERNKNEAPVEMPNAGGDMQPMKQNAADESDSHPPNKFYLIEHETPQPKLDRPQSLSLIQTSEEIVKGEVQNDNNSADELDNIENEVEKLIITENSAAKIEMNGAAESENAKKTPSHLTDQGYFDLKFYHNKLW